MGVGTVDAAVRDANSPSRQTAKSTISRSAQTTPQKSTSARTASKNIISRTATTNRDTRTATNTSRSAKPTVNNRQSTPKTNSRNTNTTTRNAQRNARATVTINTTQSNTFGTGYNTCRDAYFTCMDQFCGTANDAYRRCICSSKLTEIQSRERALANAADQISDFHNLNMAVIDKTAAEVNAMTSATIGEYTQSISRDKSDSASELAGISAVLSQAKNKSLSTQGTLDIAGDIDKIWATSNLAGGSNIANLTGEALYNAVHAQCSQLVIDKCPNQSTQTMVVSAYGMYIENDCSLLINNLDKKLSSANATIRDTEREMHLARLENYDAHNSTPINDCIAQVRADITTNAACGPDYIHCLDITGRYLNIETGEPIYSPNFYQLESQISLSGDILTNETNRLLVAELNRKRDFATRGLDTCRDIADTVWDEFMRQAITEIYQSQHERIRNVKNECLDVVNQCYDTQTQSLKDFSNIKEQLLLGSRLELSEEMCREKLDTCSNLYGGGSHGMAELITTMHNITSQQIAKECITTLQSYARDLCAVPSNDSLHAYPFACRVYAPGEQIYATIQECNAKTQNSSSGTTSDSSSGNNTTGYNCPDKKRYTSCKDGYYLTFEGKYNKEPTVGNSCTECPTGCKCSGGTNDKICNTENICGDDYVGSLYHKLARYATQACVRPSESEKPLPASVLQDINVVMDQIRIDMANSLSAECERLGGIWVDTVWIDEKTTGDTLFKKFYSETSANTKWGYCADANDTAEQSETNEQQGDT